MKKINLAVSGMTCSACSNGLEKYLNKQVGVFEATVNLIFSNVIVVYDENKISQNDIENFINDAGFKSDGEFNFNKISNTNISKKDILHFIISFIFIAFFITNFIFNYLFKISLINFAPSFYYDLFSFFIAIYFLFFGFDILKNGYKNFIHKNPNMDSLVTISVISSFIYSLYNLYLTYIKNISNTQLYFESCMMVIFFVKFGRLIEEFAKDKTKEAISKLVTITPSFGIIKKDGIQKRVTIDEIKKEDIVVSKIGEKIAVDGNVILGKAYVNESFITGESKLSVKDINSKVLAGSLVEDGYIEYRALQIGRESTVSKIVTLVSKVSSQKLKNLRFIDTVCEYFVPSVIVIAIFSFILGLIVGSTFQDAMVKFVSVLVVACPCTLGLAVPLSIIAGENALVKKGILVKNGQILETAKKTNVVAFDKTGTLTYGCLKIYKIINYSKVSNEDILKIVGVLESKSNHPIGQAFKDYFDSKVIFNEFENFKGLGIRGKIDNAQYVLGNHKILEKFSILLPNDCIKNDEKLLASQGCSIVYVAKNKDIIAIIGLKDILRENVREGIRLLKSKNIEPVIITGDNELSAQMIASLIGIQKVYANMLPHDKVNIIKKLQEEDKKFVIMCGDGINDAPSLKQANIGLSIDTGTEVSIDCADAVIKNNNLKNVYSLIDISQKTLKLIKLNLFFAFIYNIMMIPIAAGVFSYFEISINNISLSFLKLNPQTASFLMVVSSLSVLLSTIVFSRGVLLDKN